MSILYKLNKLLKEDYISDKEYRDWVRQDLKYIIDNWYDLDKLNQKIYVGKEKGVKIGGIQIKYGELTIAFCYADSPEDIWYQAAYFPNKNHINVIVGKTPDDVTIYSDFIVKQTKDNEFNGKIKFFKFALNDIKQKIKNDKEIQKNIFHEMIHYYDFQRTHMKIGSSIKSSKNFSAYINTPVEFNSRFQEIVFLIDEAIDNNQLNSVMKEALLKLSNPDDALEWLSDLSTPFYSEPNVLPKALFYSIRTFLNNLDDKYMKKFKKRFYQYIQGKKAEVYDEKEKITYHNAIEIIDNFIDEYFQTALKPRKKMYKNYIEKFKEMKSLEPVLWMENFMNIIMLALPLEDSYTLSQLYPKVFELHESKYKSVFNSKFKEFIQHINRYVGI